MAITMYTSNTTLSLPPLPPVNRFERESFVRITSNRSSLYDPRHRLLLLASIVPPPSLIHPANLRGKLGRFLPPSLDNNRADQKETLLSSSGETEEKSETFRKTIHKLKSIDTILRKAKTSSHRRIRLKGQGREEAEGQRRGRGRRGRARNYLTRLLDFF